MFTRMPHAEPPPLARAKVGKILRGKWHLDALLGAGGMATVYAATHRNGKRGAVKILHGEVAVDLNARTRFLQEGYAANKVGHPGAVSVLDDDEDDDGSVFLVMELLDGESADGRAQKRPGERLEILEVATLADQLLDVLAAAHDKGIVHRDIKPENIFLTRDGGLKVLDFGIARIREVKGMDSARLTANTGPMGTPAFMPPEQALGKWDDVGPWTDLWAVGATMFTLLSGQCVHHSAENINLLLLAAMTKPAPPIAGVVPGIPAALAAVIDRALAFDPRHRWADARAMQQALRAIPRAQLVMAPMARATLQSFGAEPPPQRGPSGGSVQGLSTVAPVSSDRPTQRRAAMSALRLYAVVALALGVGVAAATFVLLRRQPEGTPVVATATPLPSVNTVSPVETTSVPVVAPAVSVAPAVVAATPSVRPVVSAAPVKSSRPVTAPVPVPVPVKTARPKDPLEKF
ncbi:MAG: serine/threonine-protein kinase [Byssovorax sp.]